MKIQNSLQDGWVEMKTGLHRGYCQYPALRGTEAAAQEAERKDRPRGKRERREGIADRKEETMEENEEQRALYTRAKRQGDAMPDQVELNPKRQHTGT